MRLWVLVQEAQQERKIGEIAKSIVDRGGVKFVMIAGPSSSGKTSFSHRLSIQLKTLGKTPHPIALDDYFVNREFTPRDENGDYNFECLEAIDVKQFNDDMCRLLAGERVEQPLCRPLSMAEQVMTLCAANGRVMLDVPVDHVKDFQMQFLSYMKEQHSDIVRQLETTKALDDELNKQICDAATEFKKEFLQK